MTHDQLLQKACVLCGSGYGRPLRTSVKNIRRKLGDDASSPKYIFTVPRVGCRMAQRDT